MEFIKWFFQKMLIKNVKYVLHSLYALKTHPKTTKTTQKCLIFWNLLGVLINKVLIKIPNLSKMFAIFEFIR